MNTRQRMTMLDTKKLIESIESELTECPKCRRNNYISSPWIAIRDIRLLVNETNRLMEELEKRLNLENQI
jgi:hypothetical protein